MTFVLLAALAVSLFYNLRQHSNILDLESSNRGLYMVNSELATRWAEATKQVNAMMDALLGGS